MQNEREEEPGRLDELDGTPSDLGGRRGIMLVIISKLEISKLNSSK